MADFRLKISGVISIKYITPEILIEKIGSKELENRRVLVAQEVYFRKKKESIMQINLTQLKNKNRMILKRKIMWPKAYKDYPRDQPLIKYQVQPGHGIIGCEMHELNGWGTDFHIPKGKFFKKIEPQGSKAVPALRASTT